MIKTLAVSALALAFSTPAAFAATTFNFESTGIGYYAGALTVFDGATTMTVTPNGNPSGFVLVDNGSVSSIPALLGTKAVIGSKVNPIASGQFSALRFTFSQLIDSITFNFGDAGGDNDTPVTIAAYSAGGTLLGSVTDTYPTGFGTGKSQTLNFLGAKYYIASSLGGESNDNSIFWDISNFRLAAAGAVPEPASWAMMLLGFGIVGSALRRRSSTSVSFA
jgi:PEP-CTERM motif